jgi:hypothetical protein
MMIAPNALGKTLGKSLATAALAATAIATIASPAMADPWRGGYYRHHGGDSTGAAIAGGIVGLAVGAAIAGSGRDRVVYRETYYEPEYYPAPAYYPAPVYYPAPRYYQGPSYYYGRPYHARPWRYEHRGYWRRGW